MKSNDGVTYLKREVFTVLQRSEITACHEKIKLLKVVIKETQLSTVHGVLRIRQKFIALLKEKKELNNILLSLVLADIERNAEDIKNRRSNVAYNAECAQKIQLLQKECLENYLERLEKLKACQSELKVVVRENINNLVKLIFPIRRVCAEER